VRAFYPVLDGKTFVKTVAGGGAVMRGEIPLERKHGGFLCKEQRGLTYASYWWTLTP
jgi:hypothetical protein